MIKYIAVVAATFCIMSANAHTSEATASPDTVKTTSEFAAQKLATPNTNVQIGAPLSEGDGTIVEGVVTSVCQKKGCWMTLKTESGERFVRFKDYGFFVPKDLTGRKVKIKAIDKDVEVSESDRKHFLKDAGASSSEISKVSGPTRRNEWLASGVEVLK